MPARDIRRNIDSVLRDIASRRTQGLRQFRSLLDRLRQQVVLAIVQAEGLTPTTVEGIRGAVDQLVRTYSSEMQALMTDEARRHFLRGIQLIDRVLRGAELQVALPHLSENILEQAATFRADLVTNLTTDTRTRVVQELQLAVLGEKPRDEVIRNIGRSLRSGSVFGSVWARAEVIYTTEMARMQNIASVQRIAQATQQVPDLEKRWLHSHLGEPRMNHLAMDGVTVKAKELFSLPDGRNASKVWKVKGPHDPRLPASEVIRCRCVVIPVVPRLRKEFPVTLNRELGKLPMLPPTPVPTPVSPTRVQPPPPSLSTISAPLPTRPAVRVPTNVPAAPSRPMPAAPPQTAPLPTAPASNWSAQKQQLEGALRQIASTDNPFDGTPTYNASAGVNPSEWMQVNGDGTVLVKSGSNRESSAAGRRSIFWNEQNAREQLHYDIYKELPELQKHFAHPVVIAQPKTASGAREADVWMERMDGFSNAYDVKGSLLAGMTAEQRQAFTNSSAVGQLHDMTFWATDRHRMNWMVNKKTGQKLLIDNGLGFGMQKTAIVTGGKDLIATDSVKSDFIFWKQTETKNEIAEQRELLAYLESVKRDLLDSGKLRQLLDTHNMKWAGHADGRDAYVQQTTERVDNLIALVRRMPGTFTLDALRKELAVMFRSEWRRM